VYGLHAPIKSLESAQMKDLGAFFESGIAAQYANR